MATGHDIRTAYPGNGQQTSVSGTYKYLDHAGRESSRHGAHRNQDTGRHESSRRFTGWDSANRDSDAADSFWTAADTIYLRGTGLARLLCERGSEPPRSR